MYNIKLAIRNLLRQRMGTVINVTGLSLSLAVCLLIALFVQYEYAFENTIRRQKCLSVAECF